MSVLVRDAAPSQEQPAVTAIRTGTYPTYEEGSFYVGRHGPTPSFVIEITSHNKPERDIERKKWGYAAVGVPEYLVIDGWLDKTKPLQLTGYRLGDNPFYLSRDHTRRQRGHHF